MDNRANIISKIASMSKLSEDSGAFENEASNAANMIKMLMEKYSISWAEVHQTESIRQNTEFERAFETKHSDFTHGFIKKWNWDLARIVAKITHTQYFLSGKYMFFFGVDENAQVAQALYTQWVVAIDVAAKDALKKYRAWLVKEFYTGQKNFYTQLPEQYQTKNYRESWITGCLAGISKNINEDNTSSALVLYDEEVKKKFQQRYTKMKHVSTHGPKNISTRGFADGTKFGSSINLGSKPLDKGK